MPDQVLLIDDDPRLVSVLQLRLASIGYQVHAASNGEDGLAVAALYRPDVIVLDIRMPQMDGYGVCRLIRAVPELWSIPIIILSASTAESSAKAILDAGGNIFLSKPYQWPQLQKAIRIAIDFHRTTKEMTDACWRVESK